MISFISNALNRRHAHPQSQSLSQQPPAQYDRRQDPQGLTTLYTPPSLPSADIIFIHGLGGSSQATWCKNHDLDLFWPSKWLPLDTDIGTARIFSFGYDAPFLSPQKGGVMGIGDFAKDLLYQMRFPPDGDDGGLPIGKVCRQSCPCVNWLLRLISVRLSSSRTRWGVLFLNRCVLHDTPSTCMIDSLVGVLIRER